MNTTEQLLFKAPVVQRNDPYRVLNLEQGSDAWHAARADHITASNCIDAIALKRSYWEEKTGLKPNTFTGNESTERGNLLEPDARAAFEWELDQEFPPVCLELGYLMASLDGFNGTMPLEIKCPSSDEKHQAHIDGEICQQYWQQMQFQMAIAGADQCWFVSYRPEHKTPLHKVLINFDAQWWQQAAPKLEEMWARIETMTWPDESASLDVITQRVNAQSAAPAPVSTGMIPPAMAAAGVPDEIHHRAGELVAAANGLTVHDGQSAEDATDIIKSLRGLRTKVEAVRKEIVSPHNDFIKGINGAFKKVQAPIDEAGKSLTKRLQAWQDEQEAIRLERIRKQQEELRRQQEEEQRLLREAQAKRAAEERAAAAAEQARIDAELKAARAKQDAAAAEEAKRQAEAAAQRYKEQAARAAEAAKAEAARLEEEAKARAQALEQETKVNTPTRGMTGATASKRKTWAFEVVDKAMVPMDWLLIDEKAIGAAIRRKRQPVREIPGVRIFQQSSTVVR
ncbi:MAG: YqaJ viral recombinase family protein [Mariprofundales bacterium]